VATSSEATTTSAKKDKSRLLQPGVGMESQQATNRLATAPTAMSGDTRRNLNRRATLYFEDEEGEAQVRSICYDSRIAGFRPNTVCHHFLLLLTLAGCGVYSGDGGGYSRGPAYYDYGGMGTGYAPYYQHDRQDRRWQDQGAPEQRRHNPQPAYVPPPPPSATQNPKALENLGFRPNR
jgi:hypothetical protein